MSPVATDNENRGASTSLPEMRNAVSGVLSELKPSLWTNRAVMFGITLGFVALSVTLLLVARFAFSHSFYPLIGVVCSFAVARMFGVVAGNLYVCGWLYALHRLHIFAATDHATAIAQYSETALLYFLVVGIGCWMRNQDEKVTFYQRERDIWSGVITGVEKRQRRFLREVLSTVTSGSLILCDTDSELPAALPFAPNESSIPLQSAALSDVRVRIRDAAKHVRLNNDATGDLVIAGSEAALNAVVHGQGGVAEIRAADKGRVQIWVRDNGKGIDDALLHRATLEAGFSSKGTLGQGFSLMVSTCKRVYILTGSHGTTIVLQNYAD